MLENFISDGTKALERHNYGSAARWFEKAININPSSVEALSQLSIAYRRLAEFDKAISTIQTAIEIDCDNEGLHETLAINYMAIANYGLAAISFENALKLTVEPVKTSELYSRLALCHQKNGDNRAAAVALKESIRNYRTKAYDLYGYMFDELGWSTLVSKFERELDAEIKADASIMATTGIARPNPGSLTAKVALLSHDFLAEKKNETMIYNLLSRIPDKLLLSIFNIKEIEDKLLRRHFKITGFFLSTGQNIYSLNGQVDYFLIDDFFDSYLDKLSKLLTTKLNISATDICDNLAYKLILEVGKKYYFDAAISEFGDILKNTTTTKTCIQIIVNSGHINIENYRIRGLLTHFLIGTAIIADTVDENSADNYIKCFTALSSLIENIIENKSVNDFENMLLSSPSARHITIDDTDMMTGQEFEVIVSKLFEDIGYKVTHTKASGDQGVDVVAEKDGVKIGIQTKCYSKPVSNSAIQEIVAGIRHYGCTKGMVVTNCIFTKSAYELAESNNIILWDRSMLAQKLNMAPKHKGVEA